MKFIVVFSLRILLLDRFHRFDVNVHVHSNSQIWPVINWIDHIGSASRFCFFKTIWNLEHTNGQLKCLLIFAQINRIQYGSNCFKFIAVLICKFALTVHRNHRSNESLVWAHFRIGLFSNHLLWFIHVNWRFFFLLFN